MRILVFFLIALSAPAFAQEERRWVANTYDGGASLVYGTPESDDLVIGFGCDTDSNELRITHMVAEPGALTGEEVELVLASGETRRTFTAEVFADESGNAGGVGAVTDFSADLFGFLEGETLTAGVGPSTTEIPLAGALDVVDLLVETCGE